MKRYIKFKKTSISIGIILLAAIVTWNSLHYTAKPANKNNKKARYLVVISIDALNSLDYDCIKDLPNFKFLMDNGSYAKEVIGVYPSLTYPSHASIITGVYPDKHGICSNEINEPGVKKQKWYWYSKDIKVPTLYDAAKRQGKTVGALFWPVTAGGNIDYLLPEIWNVKGNKSQIQAALKYGSPVFDIILKNKFASYLKIGSKSHLDNFTAASAAYMIKIKRPDLSLIHLTEVDHMRHKYGVMSKEVNTVLKNEDGRIGKIIQAVKDAGIYRDTAFIVIGDHGFRDVDYRICMNTALRNAGLISVDKGGKLLDWKAYVNSCDGSAQVFLKDQNDSETRNKVEQILYEYKNNDDSIIKEIYTKEQCKEKRVTGDFTYMLEAEKGYYFANDWALKDVINKRKEYHATHGYDPLTPGYRTFFIASGAGIRKNVIIPSINLVDECPTMAKLLGVDMGNVDGRVLNEIIKK